MTVSAQNLDRSLTGPNRPLLQERECLLVCSVNSASITGWARQPAAGWPTQQPPQPQLTPDHFPVSPQG